MGQQSSIHAVRVHVHLYVLWLRQVEADSASIGAGPRHTSNLGFRVRVRVWVTGPWFGPKIVDRMTLDWGLTTPTNHT